MDDASSACLLEALQVICKQKLMTFVDIIVGLNDDAILLCSKIKAGEATREELECVGDGDILWTAIFEILKESPVFAGLTSIESIQSFVDSLPGHTKRLLGAIFSTSELILEKYPEKVDIITNSMLCSMFSPEGKHLFIEIVRDYKSLFSYAFTFCRRFGKPPKIDIKIWQDAINKQTQKSSTVEKNINISSFINDSTDSLNISNSIVGIELEADTASVMAVRNSYDWNIAYEEDEDSDTPDYVNNSFQTNHIKTRKATRLSASKKQLNHDDLITNNSRKKKSSLLITLSNDSIPSATSTAESHNINNNKIKHSIMSEKSDDIGLSLESYDRQDNDDYPLESEENSKSESHDSSGYYRRNGSESFTKSNDDFKEYNPSDLGSRDDRKEGGLHSKRLPLQQSSDNEGLYEDPKGNQDSIHHSNFNNNRTAKNNYHHSSSIHRHKDASGISIDDLRYVFQQCLSMGSDKASVRQLVASAELQQVRGLTMDLQLRYPMAGLVSWDALSTMASPYLNHPPLPEATERISAASSIFTRNYDSDGNNDNDSDVGGSTSYENSRIQKQSFDKNTNKKWESSSNINNSDSYYDEDSLRESSDAVLFNTINKYNRNNINQYPPSEDDNNSRSNNSNSNNGSTNRTLFQSYDSLTNSITNHEDNKEIENNDDNDDDDDSYDEDIAILAKAAASVSKALDVIPSDETSKHHHHHHQEEEDPPRSLFLPPTTQLIAKEAQHQQQQLQQQHVSNASSNNWSSNDRRLKQDDVPSRHEEGLTGIDGTNNNNKGNVSKGWIQATKKTDIPLTNSMTTKDLNNVNNTTNKHPVTSNFHSTTRNINNNIKEVEAALVSTNRPPSNSSAFSKPPSIIRSSSVEPVLTPAPVNTTSLRKSLKSTVSFEGDRNDNNNNNNNNNNNGNTFEIEVVSSRSRGGSNSRAMGLGSSAQDIVLTSSLSVEPSSHLVDSKYEEEKNLEDAYGDKLDRRETNDNDVDGNALGLVPADKYSGNYIRQNKEGRSTIPSSCKASESYLSQQVDGDDEEEDEDADYLEDDGRVKGMATSSRASSAADSEGDSELMATLLQGLPSAPIDIKIGCYTPDRNALPQYLQSRVYSEGFPEGMSPPRLSEFNQLSGVILEGYLLKKSKTGFRLPRYFSVNTSMTAVSAASPTSPPLLTNCTLQIYKKATPSAWGLLPLQLRRIVPFSHIISIEAVSALRSKGRSFTICYCITQDTTTTTGIPNQSYVPYQERKQNMKIINSNSKVLYLRAVDAQSRFLWVKTLQRLLTLLNEDYPLLQLQRSNDLDTPE